jgi:putative glutamine amidotransferase
MATVALTSANPRNARRYIEVLETLGVETRLLLPTDAGSRSAEVLMEGVGGLLLPGGPDVDPILYGCSPDPDAGLKVCRPLDDLDLQLLGYALEQDMPVLVICRGMQVLNVAFGGQLIQDLPGHRMEQQDGRWVPQRHQIFLSPGAKAAAVIGTAGFFRVNSLHHQGLREAQRSPRLMATAYDVEDGLVEGLESPEHSWVIGLQCHPERQDEVPRVFANLFTAFGERAEAHEASRAA